MRCFLISLTRLYDMTMTNEYINLKKERKYLSTTTNNKKIYTSQTYKKI